MACRAASSQNAASAGPGRVCACASNGPKAASSLKSTICTHGNFLTRSSSRRPMAVTFSWLAETSIWTPAIANGLIGVRSYRGSGDFDRRALGAAPQARLGAASRPAPMPMVLASLLRQPERSEDRLELRAYRQREVLAGRHAPLEPPAVDPPQLPALR